MNKKKLTCYLLVAVSILKSPERVNATDNGHPVRLSSKAYHSKPNPEIDKNKFTALCQFWINKAETAYGFIPKELLKYKLTPASYYAFFRLDKLKISFSYSTNIKYKGGEEHTISVWFWFDQNKDYEEFLRSKPFAGMKDKKTKINYYPAISRIDIDNYPAEEQDAYKRIYFGYASHISLNVKAAFDSAAQIALRQPQPGENILAVYRDKANRYFSGEGVLLNFETARDFYQKAWELGDDTSGLYLGFLYLEYSTIGELNKLYNPVLAKTYFDSVCLSGSPIGNYGAGWIYYNGYRYEGIPKDIPKAISYYEKGAAKADICCISALYYIYSREPGFLDPEKAKLYYQQMIYLNPESKEIKCRPGDIHLNFTKWK